MSLCLSALPVANVVTPTVVGPDVPALFTALTAIE